MIEPGQIYRGKLPRYFVPIDFSNPVNTYEMEIIEVSDESFSYNSFGMYDGARIFSISKGRKTKAFEEMKQEIDHGHLVLQPDYHIDQW